MPRLTELRGFDQADAKLRKIGLVLNGPEVSAVMARAAGIIQAEVIRREPLGIGTKRPGRLKRAVLVRPLPASKPGKPAGAIVLMNYSARRGPTAPHAHLVEKGTRAHVIYAKKAGEPLLVFGKFPRLFVHHPGAKGRHAFEDAVADTRGRARIAIREGIAELIERAAG